MKNILLLLSLLMTTSVFAIDFQTARSKGIIGELPTGYVAVVKGEANEEIALIIKTINEKRTAKFQEISTKTGADSVGSVGVMVHKKILKSLAEGIFYKNESGSWVRK
jgi:uncharacterized protein YdbL (DUF1318 family)